jgi:coproporphyrinogen III oxidase-like Fe-S oxidoreductase
LKAEVDAFARSKGISYGDKFNRLLKEGFLSLNEDRFRVTSKGYFILNGILGVLAA